MIRLFENGRIFSSCENIFPGKILISGDTIIGVFTPTEEISKKPDLIVNLEGRLVFPGLINSHDHLYHTFWPPFGTPPYQNWYEWNQEIKSMPAYKLKQKLSITDFYTLGMYRNLLSGVTLVVDHFPKEIAKSFLQMPHIGFLEDFCLAHSVSSHALEWSSGVLDEFKKTKGVYPFILHAEEGFDSEIQAEVETLCRMGVLASNTVLVNGLGFSQADVETIAGRNASVILTPSSNAFLYQKHAPIVSMLDAGVRLALGTDCPLGSINLFDELRNARDLSKNHLSGRLTDANLISMVTVNPAKIFGIEKSHGAISVGKKADFLIFEDFKNNPIESFFALTPKDISLLVRHGDMMFGEDKFRSVCSLNFDHFSEVLVDRLPKLLWGKPIELLERIEQKLGEPRKFPFLPVNEP